MATTTYFEKTISDKEEKDIKIKLEFGRTSFCGENLMYFTIDDTSLAVDAKTGREIFEAMQSLGAYLGYD